MIPRGCELCTSGAKLTLLITGECRRNCYYCPLSEKKKGKDVIYANEKFVNEEGDIIEEAKLMNALGAAFTGGEPLIKIDRTLRYLDILKEEFGDKFHIHLYTAEFVDIGLAEKLHSHGLDEIRFHVIPESWSKDDYDPSIRNCLNSGISTGVEIPAIPSSSHKILGLAEHLESIGVEFLNLNELEYSDTNYEELNARGFELKPDSIAGVYSSEGCAKEVKKLFKKDMIIHYCSSAFKDGVQLKNRLLRRARNVARGWELITSEGTLVRGVIEVDAGSNSESEENMKAMKDYLEKRKIQYSVTMKVTMKDAMKVTMKDAMKVTMKDQSIELSPWTLFNIYRSIPVSVRSYIVESYPTADALEVERTPLI